jgi:CheY-like chemotaxis protein
MTAEILLLSGNEEEVSLIRRAAQKNRLNVVDACPAVLQYLRTEGQHSGARRPDLIFLDLDLSTQEECEMLEEIKQDPKFKRIPLIVLASSDSPRNVFQAYDLHANAYISKPKDREAFVKVIRATLLFWLDLARLPQE